MNTKKTKFIYFEDINILSGWAIFLVVVGHLPFLTELKEYVFMRDMIYSFHMPIFMVISGFLFSNRSRKMIQNKRNFKLFLIKKVKQLGFPYTFTVILFFAVKINMGTFIELKHPVNLDSFFQMFINPKDKGFVIHLWFIYTLLVIFILYPVLEKATKRIDLRLKLVFYLMLSYFPWTHFFCLNLAFYYMFYFHLGNVLEQYRFKISNSSLFSYGIICLLSFIMLFSYFDFIAKDMLLSFLGMSFSYCLAKWIMLKKFFLTDFFSLLGMFSFEIYLFHTLGSETFAYILKIFKLPISINYFLIIIFSTFFGLFLPIVLTKLLRKMQPILAYTLLGK